MIRSILSASASFLLLVLTATLSCSTDKPVVVQEPPQIIEVKHVKRYDDPVINSIVVGAWANYSHGRFEQSALDFERLIAKGYTHYDVLFGAGCANMKYYDLKKALTFFDRCIKERKDHFDALFFRADIYRQMKNYPKARADLELLLTIETASSEICGLYASEIADRNALSKRKSEAADILKTM